ncbi:MAG: (d)CMP kinase, partial [Bacteroidota bacterium]
MIIAIDGYSSCGKSTVAKAIAKRLKLNYIDSGAMYRAVTYYFLQNNIPF